MDHYLIQYIIRCGVFFSQTTFVTCKLSSELIKKAIVPVQQGIAGKTRLIGEPHSAVVGDCVPYQCALAACHRIGWLWLLICPVNSHGR